MHIRPKADSDEPGCLALLLAVHRADGYPRYLPDDALRFITPPYESAAWVAEEDGEIVGHVGLHNAAADPTFNAAQRATDMMRSAACWTLGGCQLRNQETRSVAPLLTPRQIGALRPVSD